MFRRVPAGASKLLGDLASAEVQHAKVATTAEQRLPGANHDAEDDNARHRFILQVIQPELVAPMDGSMSRPASMFAAASATYQPRNAFLVGMEASIGLGVRMGFAEALADDGRLSGRGATLLRGLVCGLMTTVGGIGHMLPFLTASLCTAVIVAAVVVVVELSAIDYIQHRSMETPPSSAVAKVMLSEAPVHAAGILIGGG